MRQVSWRTKQRGSIVRRTKVRFGADGVLLLLTRGSALAIVLMLLSLVLVLARAAVPSIRTFGARFITSSEWRPNELEQPKRGPDGKLVMEDGEIVMEKLLPRFGGLPVIYGTAVSSVLALLFAVPLGLGAAIFLVRVAPKLKIAGPVSFLIEFLAAVPSIAFGIWGLFVLAPFLQTHVEPLLKTALFNVPGLAWLFTENVKVGTSTITREISLTGRDMFCGGIVMGAGPGTLKAAKQLDRSIRRPFVSRPDAAARPARLE